MPDSHRKQPYFGAFLRLWLIVVSSCSFAAPLYANTPAAHQALPEINVAVLAFRPKPQELARWQPLVDYLNHTIDIAHFTLSAHTNDELDQAVARGEVDFVFLQPSHYVRLTYTHSLSSPLATLINLQNALPVEVFAGVIFARRDRDEIEYITDLPGKTIATPDINGLGGFQMQAFELLRAGISQRQYQVLQTGQPQDRVVRAVLEGQADAGFVRTGLLESMYANGLLDPSQVKVLNINTSNPDFPFIASTRFYPEWPFSALSHVDPELARQVSTALLTMPHGGEVAQAMRIHGFTIPGDYRNIDQLLRELRMPPFEQAPIVSLQDIWDNWRSLILFSLLFILLLAITIIAILVYRNHHLLRTQRELQLSLDENQKLKYAVEQSPNSIAITDLDSRIIYINSTFIHNTGYSPQDILGKKMNVFKSGKNPLSVYQQLWRSLKRGETWKGELINIYHDGQEHIDEIIASPIKNTQGQIFAYLAIKQDITLRKQSEAHIQQLAYHDSLTGLANRSRLREEVAYQLQTNDQSLHHCLLFLLNIDRFKFINDARGHRIGDELLKAFSARIQHEFEAVPSVLARTSADEFALLIKSDYPGYSYDTVTAIAIGERLHKLAQSPFILADEQVKISISVGVIQLPESGDLQPEHALQRADTALSHARRAGGNQTAVFDPSMRQEITDRYELEAELREAIHCDALSLYLQPQYHPDGSLYGAEVLLRWLHPNRGSIPPGIFIPLAEKSNLIIELSEYVFTQSLALLARIHQQGLALHLSINVSPKHCYKSNLVEWLKDQFSHHQIDPNYITLEITEGLFIDNVQVVAERMQDLSSLGVKFSIDDFGTGYSSLAYLKQLPINEIKIDKSFIQYAPIDKADAALVDTILAVAKHMELSVVAEGVETPQQAEFLLRRDDVIQQGYLHGRPEPAEYWIERWLSKP